MPPGRGPIRALGRLGQGAQGLGVPVPVGHKQQGLGWGSSLPPPPPSGKGGGGGKGARGSCQKNRASLKTLGVLARLLQCLGQGGQGRGGKGGCLCSSCATRPQAYSKAQGRGGVTWVGRHKGEGIGGEGGEGGGGVLGGSDNAIPNRTKNSKVCTTKTHRTIMTKTTPRFQNPVRRSQSRKTKVCNPKSLSFYVTANLSTRHPLTMLVCAGITSTTKPSSPGCSSSRQATGDQLPLGGPAAVAATSRLFIRS